MAIKGRTKYTIYLDANEVETIKDLFASANYKPGLSGFFNDYVIQFAKQIREAVENNEIDSFIEYYRELKP